MLGKFLLGCAIIRLRFSNTLPNKYSVTILDDPHACIFSSESCNRERNCAWFNFHHSCLLTPILPWTNLQKIECCLRCCILHYLKHYSLLGHADENSSFGLARYSEMKIPTNIIWSELLSLSISHAIYSDAVNFGLSSSYKMTTTISNSTFMNLKGGNLILVSYIENCLPYKVYDYLINQRATYGNKKILFWFSNALFCDGSEHFPTVNDDIRYEDAFNMLISGVRNSEILSEYMANATYYYPSTMVNNNRENSSRKTWRARMAILSCAGIDIDKHMDLNRRKFLYKYYSACRSSSNYYYATLTSSKVLNDKLSMLNKMKIKVEHNDHSSNLKYIYSSYSQSRFVLLPALDSSDAITSSVAEAILLGAIPVVLDPNYAAKATPLKLNSTTSPRLYSLHKLHLMYAHLPIIVVNDIYELRPTLLNTKADYIFSNIHRFDISRLFFPYWLSQFTKGMLGGSNLRRPWDRTIDQLRKRASRVQSNTTCATLQSYNTNVGANKPNFQRRRFRERVMKSKNVSWSRYTAESGPHGLQPLRQLRRRNGSEGSGSYLRSHYGGEPPSGNGSDRSSSSSVSRPRYDRRLASIGDIAGTDRRVGAVGSGLSLDHMDGKQVQSNGTPARGRTGREAAVSDSDPLLGPGQAGVEIVVPRCCEKQFEMRWLHDLLDIFPHLHASVYYKCPYCIPYHMSETWLPIIENDDVLRSRVLTHDNGVHLLDERVGRAADRADSGRAGAPLAGGYSSVESFLGYGSRVQELMCFDTALNGKEALAYVTHMARRYHTLAGYTLFLHSDPASHIQFEVLSRVLIWTSVCPPDEREERGKAVVSGLVQKQTLDFLHLNAIFLRTSDWGSCCGKNGRCKRALFQGLGLHGVLPEDDVAAYKGGQFLASKSAIQRHPLRLWENLLSYLNGSRALVGCHVFKDWNRGPQIGAQLERVWHVLFGKPAFLLQRSVEPELPLYLRVKDCGGFRKCDDAVR